MRFLSLLSGGLILLTTSTASFGGDKEIEPEVGFEIELRDAFLSRAALWSRRMQSSERVRRHTEGVIEKIRNEIVEEGKSEALGRGAIIPSPFANPPNVDDRFTTYLLRGPRDEYTTSGPWIAYTTDPFVMELKGQKRRVSQLEEYEAAYEKELFQRPARHGFTPSRFSNSTHITLDWVTTFGLDPLTSLENGLEFVTDWANQGLTSGTLLYDPRNSRGLRSSKKMIDSVNTIFNEVRGALGRKLSDQAAIKLQRLNYSLPTGTLGFPEIRIDIEFEEDEDGNRVISSASKLEVRGFRGVENFHEVIQLAKMLVARAQVLQARKKAGAPPIELNTKVTAIHIADTSGFKQFIEDTGLKWGDYEVFAKRAYNFCNIALTPLKFFF